MDLKDALDLLKTDKRMFDWNLRRGNISNEEIQKHLDKLPDEAHNSVSFDLEESDYEGNGHAN